MGTRGLRVYRFHKRYYVFYNHWDSYPEGLGEKIVQEIPQDPAAYQAWLSAERARIAQWEAAFEDFITIMPANVINYPRTEKVENTEAGDNDGSDKGSDIEGEQSETESANEEKKTPDWMEHRFPSLFPPLNDTFIEYIYTLVRSG